MPREFDIRGICRVPLGVSCVYCMIRS